VSRRGVAVLVWAIALLDVVAVSLVAFGVLPEPPSDPQGGGAIFLVLTVAFGVVGSRVVTRDPRNRVGWVLWTAPTLLALSGPGIGYARLSLEQHAGSLPGTALLAWAGGFSLVLFILLTALVIPLIFPNGHLRTTRWRPVAGLVGAAIGLTMIGLMFSPAPVLDGVDNPVGIPGAAGALELASQAGAGLILVSLPLVIASAVVRFRLGSVVERQQVKWFAVGIVVPALLLVLALAFQEVEALWVGSVAALGLVPVAIGIAILRYRLYEIDRLISRTIGWAVVTGVLVAVVAGLVVSLQAVLAPVTRENTLAVAASTLVAFALFQPLRRRVQRAVDRRFDRARYDGQRTVDAFAERLRNEVDIDAVVGDLSGTTGAAVVPITVGVWIRASRRGT
jgi:hypothetical protein